MQHVLQFIDPAQLMRITDLQLLARTVVEGVLTGLHRSPHSGAAIEFAQYRPYVQGDDPRYIDWTLYGRTDRLHIKQYQQETNLRCSILLDCSASMDYASGPVTKFAYGRVLAAALALLLDRQKDAVGFIGYHREILRFIPPRNHAEHLRQILVALDNLRPAGPTDTAGALRFLGDVIRARGMLILISDLLHPPDEMIAHLKSLRARRHDLIVFQIADPAERDFPFDKATTFVDAEDAREQFAVPDLIRAEYLENRRRHMDLIRRECLAAEIDHTELLTTEPLDRALHHFIRRRYQSLLTTSAGRRASGHRSPAGGSR